MVPVSLKLKGVFSYKNEITIDFTKLTRNYLFGIFGRTGSGKSTILESIMYALYGEVSRLDNTKQTYNMMNLASNEFAIDFIFEHKSETYRCIVTAKRKKKNYSETDTPEFRYFKNSFEPLALSNEPSHRLAQSSNGWLDKDYLGIDQGPIIIQIENYRSQFVWKLMKKNPYIVAGLKKAGFKNGWIDKVKE